MFWNWKIKRKRSSYTECLLIVDQQLFPKQFVLQILFFCTNVSNVGFHDKKIHSCKMVLFLEVTKFKFYMVPKSGVSEMRSAGRKVTSIFKNNNSLYLMTEFLRLNKVMIYIWK